MAQLEMEQIALQERKLAAREKPEEQPEQVEAVEQVTQLVMVRAQVGVHVSLLALRVKLV